MLNELEKIDLLRNRAKVTYQVAQRALDLYDGDVVKALVYLEQQSYHKKEQCMDCKQIVKTIKGIIKEGNVNRIKIRKDNRIYLDIPVNVGALGVAGIFFSLPLAVMTALGTVVAWASHFKIEIERPDGKVEIRELMGSVLEDSN